MAATRAPAIPTASGPSMEMLLLELEDVEVGGGELLPLVVDNGKLWTPVDDDELLAMVDENGLLSLHDDEGTPAT